MQLQTYHVTEVAIGSACLGLEMLNAAWFLYSVRSSLREGRQWCVGRRGRQTLRRFAVGRLLARCGAA